MGRRLRQIKKHSVYETVQGIVDRQFLLVPDHYPDNPTLSKLCPKNALDPNNDLIPIPSTLNIIGAAIGRALKHVPVNLHCFEANINHKHSQESVDDSCCKGADNCELAGTPMCGGVENHPARFHQRVNSVIAQQLNKKYEREGPLFTAPQRVTECIDDEKAEEKLLYAMTNTVKDGLVEQVGESPFFSTYNFWAKGEALRFWYIEWEEYYLAGGTRKKNHRPKDYIKWVQWKPKSLPNWKGKPRHKYATFIRQQCKEKEDEFRKLRRKEGQRALGIKRLKQLDPRDRPRVPRERTRQPLCHSSSLRATKAYQKEWRNFVNEHRQASLDYRMGAHEREFPVSSFRPPLVCIYSSSHL